MTLDLDCLRVALEWHDSVDGSCPLPLEAHELLDAARLLLGAEKRWVCVHKDRWWSWTDPNIRCYSPVNAPELHADCGWRLSIPWPKEGDLAEGAFESEYQGQVESFGWNRPSVPMSRMSDFINQLLAVAL